MPTGLAVPVGVGQDGGARLSTGDENDSKIIRLALGSDDNENAFQQNIGLGDRMVFDIADSVARSKITRRLLELFRSFEAQQRYILRQNTIQWTEGEGEITLSFMYVQVESDQEKEFREVFTKQT